MLSQHMSRDALIVAWIRSFRNLLILIYWRICYSSTQINAWQLSKRCSIRMWPNSTTPRKSQYVPRRLWFRSTIIRSSPSKSTETSFILIFTRGKRRCVRRFWHSIKPTISRWVDRVVGRVVASSMLLNRLAHSSSSSSSSSSTPNSSNTSNSNISSSSTSSSNSRGNRASSSSNTHNSINEQSSTDT